jgi:hypothetical protein
MPDSYDHSIKLGGRVTTVDIVRIGDYGEAAAMVVSGSSVMGRPWRSGEVANLCSVWTWPYKAGVKNARSMVPDDLDSVPGMCNV